HEVATLERDLGVLPAHVTTLEIESAFDGGRLLQCGVQVCHGCRQGPLRTAVLTRGPRFGGIERMRVIIAIIYSSLLVVGCSGGGETRKQEKIGDDPVLEGSLGCNGSECDAA